MFEREYMFVIENVIDKWESLLRNNNTINQKGIVRHISTPAMRNITFIIIIIMINFID
jgi:hypothetical protein